MPDIVFERQITPPILGFHSLYLGIFGTSSAFLSVFFHLCFFWRKDISAPKGAGALFLPQRLKVLFLARLLESEHAGRHTGHYGIGRHRLGDNGIDAHSHIVADIDTGL